VDCPRSLTSDTRRSLFVVDDEVFLDDDQLEEVALLARRLAREIESVRDAAGPEERYRLWKIADATAQRVFHLWPANVGGDGADRD
jgi:hypothetical protein